MMKVVAVFACLAVLVLASGASAAIFFDDFESYADTSAMMASGAWGDDGGANGTLMTSGGNPGQYMDHPAGTVAAHVISPLFPSDTKPIIWEFDFLDTTNSNKRVTGGLRDNGGGAGLNSILEMGRYNANYDPESGETRDGYGIRTVFIGGDPGNWVTFQGDPAVQAGWHHFKAIIKATSILFELDLGKDGIVDGQRLVTTSDTSGIGYNILRLGGPSNLSSTGGGAGFDNVSIDQVPEPATIGLLGMAGLALLRRKRR